MVILTVTLLVSSIIPAMAADTTYHTVNFYIDDTGENLFESRIVPDGENTPEIAIPALSSGPTGSNSFWGWYTEDQVANPPIDPNDAYKFDEPVTADKDYYAVFSDKYLVQFLDGSNNELIIHSAAVSPGSPVSKPSLPILAPNAGKAFTDNWHVVSGSGTLTPTYDFASEVGSNFVLTPDFANLWTVSFVTNGSYQGSQTILNLATATQPGNPSRTGYEFKYWSENPNATAATEAADKFNFVTTQITEDKVIYAIYAGETVEYKVVYWLEKENLPLDFDRDDINNYQFAYIEPAPRTGTAGDSATILSNDSEFTSNTALRKAVLLEDPASSPVNRAAPFSQFYKANTVTLRGDDANVINVYMTRRVYTLNLPIARRPSAPADEVVAVNFPGYLTDTLTSTHNSTTLTIQSKLGLVQPETLSLFPLNYPRTIAQTTPTTETHVPNGWGTAIATGMLTLTPAYLNTEFFSTYTLASSTLTATTLTWVPVSNIKYATYCPYFESLNQSIDDQVQSTPGIGATDTHDVLSSARLQIEGLNTNDGNTISIDSSNQVFDRGNITTYFTIPKATLIGSYYFANVRPGFTAIGAVTSGVKTCFIWEMTASSGRFGQLFYNGNTQNRTDNHLYNFYSRNSYVISFDTTGYDAIPNTAPLKYETPLATIEPFDADNQIEAKAALGLTSNQEFEGWFEDRDFMIPFNFKTSTMPGDTATPNGGVIKVLYPKIVTVDHHVNFLDTQSGPLHTTLGAANGGTVDDPGLYTVHETYDYGEFLGWYTIVGSNTIRYNFESPVYADTTVFGMWATDGLTVAYDINDGNGTLPTDDNLYALNASARVAPNANFTKGSLVFAGWERYITDGARYDNIVYYPGMTFSVKSDTTLKARYINPSDAVKLTYYRNFTTSDSTKNDGAHKKHELVTPSHATVLTFTRPGYTFLGWSTDKNATDPDTGLEVNTFADFRISADTELHAVWSAIDYTVKFLPGDYGTFSPQITSGIHYLVDTPANTPAAPATPGLPGWQFAGWDKIIAPKVTQSIEYTATWSKIPYTVSYAAGGSGVTGLPGSVTLTMDDNYTVSSVTPSRSGYTFNGWVATSGITGNYSGGNVFTMPTSDVVLTANWKVVPTEPPVVTPITYTVSYDGGGDNVTGLPSGATLKEGDSYTVSGVVPSRTGYTFNGWVATSGISGNYSSGNSFTMPASDVVLTASWKTVPIVPSIVDPPVVNPPATDPPVIIPVAVTHPTVVTPEEESIEEPIAEPVEPEATVTSEKTIDKFAKQTGNPFVDLIKGNIPLGSASERGAWSLLSLLMSLVAVVVSVLLIVGALVRRKDDEDEGRDSRLRGNDSEEQDDRRLGKVLKVLTIILGVLTPVVWLWLDNLNQPVVWINRWTIFVGIVFVIHIVLLVAYKVRKNKDEKEDEDEVAYGYDAV